MPAQLRFELVGQSEAVRRLRKLAVAGQDLTPVFRDIGEYLLRTTKERFRDQEDPTGRPWKSLSDDYRKGKRRNQDKILTLDGYLGGTLNYNARPTELALGSPMEYAGSHQFGAEAGAFGSTAKGQPIPFGDIPERAFLGLSSSDETEIEQLVADYLAEQV